MGSIHANQPDTALLSGTGDLSNDYEIQHILSVAAAYLDAGQIADAEDLLIEAQDANPHHPGVKALAGKIAHIMGHATGDSLPDEPDIFPAPDVLRHFTAPLPDTDKHPPGIQRLVRAAEQYYAQDRIYSSLDLTQVLCAEQPDYPAAFVRLAELQISLGMIDQAQDLYATLKHYYDVINEPAPWLVESLRISLNPGDTSALIGYAMTLLQAGEARALDPFVPEAIARAVDMNVDAAIEMSEAYIDLMPDNAEAQALHLQILALSGDKPRFVEASRRLADEYELFELQAMRLAAEILAEDDAWIPQAERVATAIRKSPELLEPALDCLNIVEGDLANGRVQLANALLHLAVERWDDVLARTRDVDAHEIESPVDRFCLLLARAMSHEAIGTDEARSSMFEAAQAAYHPDVEPFARQTALFGRDAAPSEILNAIVDTGTDASTTAPLEFLRDANPDRLDIRMSLADAYLQARNVKDALRELRFVAEREERAGNIPGMIAAMRRISQAVPTNVEIKAKLIDGYMRRGILDEAVDEMDLIGDLYLQRNRVADAVATFTRAAEIASALGKFDRGNNLFDRAVLADPDNVPVRHAAVAYYLQTGSLEQATEQLREVVRIALDADDRDEAVAALHQIIALAPHDPGAYHRLGEVLTSLGEYTQAERVYRRLASFTPHDPVLEAKQSALAVLAAAR